MNLVHKNNVSLLIERGVKGSINSEKSFNSSVKRFLEWHTTNGYDISLQSTCLFFAGMLDCGNKIATINVMKSNVSKYFEITKQTNFIHAPEVKALLKGVAYSSDKKQKQAKSFSTFEEVKKRLLNIENLEHRLMFSMLFYSACRGEEIINLKTCDVELQDFGINITLKTKTNQFSVIEKFIPYLKAEDKNVCTVELFKIVRAHYDEEYLFTTKNGKRRSFSHFQKLFKRYFGSDKSTHSARATFVTVAIQSGATIEQIMNQTKHKSSAMVQRYNRKQDCIKNNAVNLLK